MSTPAHRPGTLAALLAGQSLARIYMNRALEAETIRGRVVDVGGARDPDYFAFLQQEAVTSIEPLDGKISGINFEMDPLPYVAGTVDTVLLCNVLEHVYNHHFLLREVRRVLGPTGHLVGFVPFWVGYHPDPHDYFRYTNEALTRMLGDAGFADATVRPLVAGPILANFNTIVLSLPRLARPVAYLWYALWDRAFVMVRPESARRNPLGYVFTASI